MYIDKKILAMIALSITAAALLVGLFSGPVAKADLVIKDRDYQLITAHAVAGGDSLFIMDNRTGMMAVFVYDQTAHGLRARRFAYVPDFFGGAR